jgi:hypothetical protein
MWEVEIRRNTVQGQPRQKKDHISINKPGVVVHTCHLSYT